MEKSNKPSKPDESSIYPSHHIILRPVLILSSHLHIRHTDGLLGILTCPLSATCHARLILLYLIILIMQSCPNVSYHKICSRINGTVQI
jgi:hypothetical protein